MVERTVLVWNKKQKTVEVSRKSESVWIVIGNYTGKTIEVKGTSESSALAHWREAARFKGT